jgi:hypothetical protein
LLTCLRYAFVILRHWEKTSVFGCNWAYDAKLIINIFNFMAKSHDNQTIQSKKWYYEFPERKKNKPNKHYYLLWAIRGHNVVSELKQLLRSTVIRKGSLFSLLQKIIKNNVKQRLLSAVYSTKSYQFKFNLIKTWPLFS